MAMSWDQWLSFVGVFIILAAYALQNFAPEKSYKKTYLTLNLVGSVFLTVTAVVNNQFGFILLEGIWALISAFSLLRALLSGRT